MRSDVRSIKYELTWGDGSGYVFVGVGGGSELVDPTVTKKEL